jgi:chain length determinant protein tyrosine kinase EpsG
MNGTVMRADEALHGPGVPVASEPQDAGRAIGAMLVDLGHLTLAQAEQVQRLAAERGMSFGDAAVMLKFLRPEDIRTALAQQYNYALLPRGGKGGVADDVIAAYSPHSEGLEALRALRSQLTFGWLRDAPRPVLSVVSTEAGDGRSWLSANMAMLFAQAGYRTLLIDADMRRPRQHELFNLDNGRGLSALLAGRSGNEVACRVHEQLRLFVIPGGLVPPNPQELLARPVFAVLLEQYAKQFDLVLIDTPAIAGSADAQILAAHAGSALMVVRRHHTRSSRLTRAMTNLGLAGAKVIGSIITEH